MAKIEVIVSPERFDSAAEMARLEADDGSSGAVSSFLGLVRGAEGFKTLTLEHYPGVTEKALEKIAGFAAGKWSLNAVLIRHRVGPMIPGEEIVLVAASAPHRRAVLEAVSFMIDTLKTRAPFWKKEATETGENWIEPTADDHQAAESWLTATGQVND